MSKQRAGTNKKDVVVEEEMREQSKVAKSEAEGGLQCEADYNIVHLKSRSIRCFFAHNHEGLEQESRASLLRL